MAKKVLTEIKLQAVGGQASPAPPVGPALGQHGVKSPPAAVLIKQALSLEKGSAEPNREKVARITQDQLRQIAEKKMKDLNANDIDAAAKIIAGTARSMGVEVV